MFDVRRGKRNSITIPEATFNILFCFRKAMIIINADAYLDCFLRCCDVTMTMTKTTTRFI